MRDDSWQWCNQFFDEGRIAFHYGQTCWDSPYQDEMIVEGININEYKHDEWLAGFKYQHDMENNHEKFVGK